MAEMGVFVQPWPLAVIDVGGQGALLFSNSSWVLGEVVGLGLVEGGADMSLRMGGNVGGVIVVDAQDVVVVEFVVDINVAVFAYVDVGGLEALVMSGVIPAVV